VLSSAICVSALAAFFGTRISALNSKVTAAVPAKHLFAWNRADSARRGLSTFAELAVSKDKREDKEEMIRLTRLNNQPLMVNSDLIKFVEQSPDTLLTLITGEKLVVRENAEEVKTRLIEFRRIVLQGLPLVWDSSALHSPPVDPREAAKQEPQK
jgi:uncharacterized protein YlzI (FlbEa/FlbD family)